MSNPQPPDPSEASLPSSFDLDTIGSPTELLLQEAFERVGAENQAVLTNFDPQENGLYVDLSLTTAHPEAELADADMTDGMRTRMLNELGVSFHRLSEDDPTNLFQCRYGNGEVDQLRLVQREDGVQVPVLTQLSSSALGNEVERVRLLSHDEAEKEKQRLEDNLDEQKLNKRLKKEFDLDEEFLQHAGISLDDKRAMVAAYDQIQQVDVVRPDTKVLKGIRRKLVKNLMPGAQFVDAVRKTEKLPEIAAEYEERIRKVAQEHNLRGKALAEFVDSERLLRLGALNKQLARRRRSVKLGSTVMSAVMPPIGAGGGALAGFELSSMSPKGATIGAVAGGIAGIALAVERRQTMKNAMRDTANGFNTSNYGSYSRFGEQLLWEQRTAQTFVAKLSNL